MPLPDTEHSGERGDDRSVRSTIDRRGGYRQFRYVAVPTGEPGTPRTGLDANVQAGCHISARSTTTTVSSLSPSSASAATANVSPITSSR